MSEIEKIKAIPLYGQTPIQVVIAMSSDWLAGPYCEDAAMEYAKLRAQLAAMTAERDALKSGLDHYASSDNWIHDGNEDKQWDCWAGHFDGPDIAREALAQVSHVA